MVDKLKNIKYYLKSIVWITWDFSGIRFIYRKINPLNNAEESQCTYKKPSTFFIWFIAIYVATFGLASQRYEAKLDKIEQKANIVVTQLSATKFEIGSARITGIQSKKCPINPEFLNPSSIISSLFREQTFCESIVKDLKNVIEDWKAYLNKANLNEADLRGANLREANLSRANLSRAKLSKANLSRANLNGANLNGANLSDANLNEANLTKVKNITFKQLSEVKTLYKATNLDYGLKNQLKNEHPELFKRPKDRYISNQ